MAIEKVLLLFVYIVGVFSAHDEPISATIEFNQQGVVGQIVFTALENGSTQIDTSFQPGNFDSWHVHYFPVDFTDDPATRCGDVGGHYDPSGRLEAAGENYTDYCNPMNQIACEAGDLEGKFGALTAGNFTFIDNDPELQLEGRYGVVGRSIVIHPHGGHGHLACANIHLDEDDTPRLYVANFMGPRVGGSIYFRQSKLEPDIGVFVYSNLYYTDGTTDSTTNHTWGLYSGDSCDDIGSLFNPTNADANNPQCGPSNIASCRVGDLSAKLGYITIHDNPNSDMASAWTDGNLYSYTYVGLNIAIRAANSGDEIIACAQIVPVAQIMARANRPPDNSLFTLYQRSPFDPTYINLPVGLPAGDYQINPDGNIRDDDTCYSDMVFTPFSPDTSQSTLDSFAAGNLSGKHNFVANNKIEDIILPLSNRGSALGHNFMITGTGDPSCGTIDLPMASDTVSIIVAQITINTAGMTGNLYMRQVVTRASNMSVPWPTLINWLLQYTTDGMNEATNHNWAVMRGSCGSTEERYNPFDVTSETTVCDPAMGSRYHKRCAVGDLSGKNGQVTIRAEGSPNRTLVATDSNLPLLGRYTVLGRSLVLYSNTDNSMIIGCGQILPENLSAMRVMLSFPVDSSVDHRILLPTAVVDLLNADDVIYGEVIVLDMMDTVGSQSCTTVTLGFIDFDGDGNADSIAMRVKQLYQNDLPPTYQRGGCADGDLQQRTGEDGSGSFINKPRVILANILILVAIFVLLN